MSYSNSLARMRDIAEASSTSEQCRKQLQKYLKGLEPTVFHSQVLVAGYIRPAKTKGGIIRTDTNVQEDRFQGNCFLVVAMGKAAFKDDHIAKFNGDSIKVGDWVMAVAADGISMYINSVPCRLYEDTRILMKVSDPEIYF